MATHPWCMELPPADIDEKDFGGGGTEEDDSPPAAHSPHGSDNWRASFFWRLIPKGECAHDLSMWGWCVSSCFVYLSILGCGHVWTICMVWWMVNQEPF
jgi:hypothetical protein